MGVIIRQSFKASISNYIGVVLGFISLIFLFPLFFTPKELGAYRLFIELGGVLSAFALMGTNSSINRFFPYFKTKDQKHNGFFFWVFSIPAVGFFLLMLFFLFFGEQFFVFINEDALQYKELFPMFILLIIANIYIAVTEVSCANHGRIAVTNFSKEVLMRLLIIAGGALFYFKIIDFKTCIWFVVGAYATTLFLNLFFLSKLTKLHMVPDFEFLKANKKLRNEILLFTLILIFSAISSLVVPKIDFILVSKLEKDLSNVAIYSIGFTLATFIEIPRRTIMQISMPIISSYLKNNQLDETEKFHKKNGTTQFLIASILFLLIWLNIDNLYAVMPKGDYYAQGKWVVFIIGLSKVIESLFSSQGAIISNSKLYKWTPFIVVMNGGFAIMFNYYFISKFGYVGGAISNIAAMLILNLFCLGLISYFLKINPFEKKQWSILFAFSLFLSIVFLGNWFSNPFVDGIVRSISIGTSYVWVLIKLNVSKDFNELILSKLPLLKKII
jgi:O-antigen/teichoic acid export membrane protein